MNRTLSMLIVGALIAAAAPAAALAESVDPVAAAQEAVAVGREKAKEVKAARETGVPDHARGTPDHATGLARAAEVLQKAAEKKAKENNGNAFGRGRSAAVHTILLEGGSPSELDSHGRKVTALVHAYNAAKHDGKPGRGLGRDKAKDDDGVGG